MPEDREFEATSLESLQDAIDQAFAEVPGDPNAEGVAGAEVVAITLQKGGFVGRTQYRVRLRASGGAEGAYP